MLIQSRKGLIISIILILSISLSHVSFGQELPSSNLSNVAPVNGTNVSVNYDITNGKLISINADAQFKSLIMLLQSTNDGKFTIGLPRSLIDARENGDDARFVVLTDNHGVNYNEIETIMERIMEIPLHKGTEKIQIIGTQILTQAPITAGPFTQSLVSSSNPVIEAPLSDNVPVIDGKWTSPNEWDKTKAISVEKNGTKMYILAQHDANFLYVIADVVTDQITPSYAPIVSYYLWMIFDTNNYQGTAFGNNEIGIGTDHTFINGTEVPTSFGSEVWTYDNQSNRVDLTFPLGYNSSMGFSSTNDPFESIHDHRIYEFRIPLSLLHNSDRYGFSLKAATCSGQDTALCRTIYALSWPFGTTTSAPSLHGILELSNETSASQTEIVPQNYLGLTVVGIISVTGIVGIIAFFKAKKSKISV